VIVLEDVELHYPAPNDGAPVPILRGANLAVDEGEFVCLLGPSGCGKTTLLNLVAGFLAPTGGRVLFRGEPVEHPGPDRAVVFQDPTLFPWLVVRENVAFGLRCLQTDRTTIDERVAACLEEVGLTEAGDAYPHELSGGQRQRAALARVLALDPPALIMDEPFGALDANTRERLQDSLLRIWQSRRRTVLFVTHSVEEAAYLADRVAILGPPPTAICEVVRLRQSRPRDRTSTLTREAADHLRERLDAMPCCFPDYTHQE